MQARDGIGVGEKTNDLRGIGFPECIPSLEDQVFAPGGQGGIPLHHGIDSRRALVKLFLGNQKIDQVGGLLPRRGVYGKSQGSDGAGAAEVLPVERARVARPHGCELAEDAGVPLVTGLGQGGRFRSAQTVGIEAGDGQFTPRKVFLPFFDEPGFDRCIHGVFLGRCSIEGRYRITISVFPPRWQRISRRQPLRLCAGQAHNQKQRQSARLGDGSQSGRHRLTIARIGGKPG